MLPHSLRLFTLLGIAFRLHLLSLALVPVLAITLALSVFPTLVPQLAHSSYWLMAAAGTVGVFVSVLLREIAQTIMARLRGLSAHSVTLHVFGGEWRTQDPGASVRDEVLLSASGLAGSLALGSALMVVLFGTVTAATPLALAGVVFFFAVVNGGLALFNLLPAYPIGTGRILRSTLLIRIRSINRANRIAATIAMLIGVSAAGAGLFALARGNIVVGTWLVLLGAIIGCLAIAELRAPP